MLKRVLLYLLASVFVIPISAQQTIKVKNATGRWELSRDITLIEAEERAFLEAKKDALRRAGVMENVWSVFGHISQENGENFQEIYSNMSTIAIAGMVNIGKKDVSEDWDPISRRMFITVTIDATVQKEESKDLTFLVEVTGIQPMYKVSDLFNFNIKVYGSDYYLKVFWFDDSGGAQLYPNDFSADKKFKVEQLYPFPFNENAEYVIEKINKESKSEKINIMVIATKEKIPFIGEVNYSSLLKWIYSIKANQRCAFYQMAIIM